MAKSMFKSLAFVTLFGATPIVMFAGTLANAAIPLRADNTNAAFYISSGLAAALGFHRDMFEPAVDVGLAKIDPRLIKSADLAYALVDKTTAIGMIENMRHTLDLADKDTKLIDPDGYAVVMIDAETMRAERAYAELLDGEITDDSVLILVIGTDAEQTLSGLDISDDQIVIDATDDVPDTFVEYTLGLGATDGNMPGTDTASMLGAAAPELVDS